MLLVTVANNDTVVFADLARAFGMGSETVRVIGDEEERQPVA